MNNKKNYFFTLFSGFGVQIAATIIVLFLIPISLNYWGPERYGALAILTSLMVYLGVSNLGVTSAASVLIAKNNNVKCKLDILKRAFFLLIFSAIGFSFVFFLINCFFKNWVYLFGKIPPAITEELSLALLMLFITFLINMPFAIMQAVFQGYQKLYLERFFALLDTMFLFIALILTIFFKQNLVFFVLIRGLFLILNNFFRFLFFYITLYKKDLSSEYHEIYNYLDVKYRTIFITGIRFLSVGIAALIVWNTDNLVISHFLGLEYVTPYSITFKAFGFAFTFISAINISIFPLMAKAMGSHDWDWINATYKKLIVTISVMGGAAWLGTVLFLRELLHLWVGTSGDAGLVVIVALGGYTYLLGLINLNNGLINTFNFLKNTIWISWLEAIINISVSIYLLQFLGLGGVALGTFCGGILGAIFLYPFILMKKSQYKIKYDFMFIIKHIGFIILPLLIVSVLNTVFVSNLVFKILIGIIILSVYGLASWQLASKEVKEFWLMILFKFLKKVPKPLGLKSL
ncbi:lipopolysaccharide biosynthesis protein [bacterium]|jgi:O-antigen/teichoic acid export membrane protein|nr:lipopolysaccharide biosynthesis protein [bacterium]MBT3580783.1 lipopolysaccharide biosynthesis protein [bacterium]MBT5988734.1 lipopolysaccharide biosynthesis protein [bacterium]